MLRARFRSVLALPAMAQSTGSGATKEAAAAGAVGNPNPMASAKAAPAVQQRSPGLNYL